MKSKTVAESAVTLSEIIFPVNINPVGTAYGGELLKIMDNAAGACAMKHCNGTVVTAGIDNIIFWAPVQVWNVINCYACLTYVSKRSMEVSVRIESDNLKTGRKESCVTAYFVYVAVDSNNMQPCDVPSLKLLNRFEEQEFESAKMRMQARKQSRSSLINSDTLSGSGKTIALFGKTNN